MDLSWNSIIEAPSAKLLEIESALIILMPSPERDRKLYYTRVLKAYFRQDVQEIERLLEVEKLWLAENNDLKGLTELRLFLKKNDGDLKKAIFLESSVQGEEWAFAEVNFILAGIHQNQGVYGEAESFYRKAAAFYLKIGAHRKSLRSELSALAAYSCARPEARLFAEYTHLYEKAMAHEENVTAGAALLNISREFQKLEGLGIALDYAHQSVELFRIGALGSREFGLSLVHRAHLLLQLKRYPLAKEDLIMALTVIHPEVQSAIQILAEKMHLNLKTLKSETTLPTWSERKEETEEPRQMGKLEARLIQLLSQRPRTKHELMDELYGSLLDYDSKENRLKNLLSRVRSRFPDLIFLDDQRYRVMEAKGKASS